MRITISFLIAMKQIAIFGYGRFGSLLGELLAGEFSLLVHDPFVEIPANEHVRPVSEEEALKCDTIIYAVPIPHFQGVIERHASTLNSDKKGKTLIDVLSVKVFPKEVFQQYLDNQHTIILTHPAFGPDSVKTTGVEHQKIVLSKLQGSEAVYQEWRKLFEKLTLDVVEMSPERHDELAARSQGVAHFIGRVLEEFGMEHTDIDTVGARQLVALKEQTCNDTWDLFYGLQTKNPYTMEMRLKLGKALNRIFSKLIPKQRNPEILTVGIQGGRGSFNEEAALYYLQKEKIENYELKYLYTTENVLQALHLGEIDAGQFAVHNSVGGIVNESLLAMAEYRFFIREEFSILISHTLMIHPDVSLSEIDSIMTHPQVLKQCRDNLKNRFPSLQLKSGTGDLIDSAKVAKAISDGEVPKNVAAMGSKILADIYNLKIVAEELQDMKENHTSFVWVERPEQ
ncbi:MAG: prephenate dehydrogenase/arogenate dehydrogenase family protein [Bdellovibrionales bacterium]|nr:prephenate dehydrogenase/arogenate dehydrogenase family protein [Bdellovibrionales bacterium]